MIIETVKAAIYIFPFIKELFLGKDKKEGDPAAPPPDPKKGRFLRQTLITLAIISVLLNTFLIEKVFTMASSVVTLKREVGVLRSTDRQMTLAPGQPPTPQPPPAKVEAIVQDGQGEDPPPVPLVPDAKPPEAAPPRDEHTRGHRAPRQTRASRSVNDPPEVRPDRAHYDRLRRIDEIR